MTTASARVACRMIARAISTALRTRSIWTPAGASSFVGPLTSTTCAPRREASAAIA